MLVLKSLIPINEIIALFSIVWKSGRFLLLNGTILLLLASAFMVSRNPNISDARKMTLFSVKIFLLLVYLLTTFGHQVGPSTILLASDAVAPLPSYITGHARYESKFNDVADRKLDLDKIARTGSQLILVSGPNLENMIPSVFHFFTKRKATIHNLTLRSPKTKIVDIESLFRRIQQEVKQYLSKKGIVFTFRDIPKEYMEAGFVELLQHMTKDPLHPIFVIFERSADVAARIRGEITSPAPLHHQHPFQRPQ
jgi:hypothetical protein